MVDIPVYEKSNGVHSTYMPDAFASDNHIEDTLTLPRLDIVNRVFYTSDGNTIELTKRRITSLILERVMNEGKPKAPHIEITLMGKHKEIQENRNDPSYIKAVEEWEGDRQLRMLRYICDVGVKGEPPKWFADEQIEYFPDATRVDLKYLWVVSQVPDGDFELFSEVLIGQTIATAKGLEESAKSFRSEDQRTDTE